MVGVLALGLGFVLSYVGAFHDPSPHRVPIAVAVPAPVAGHLVDELNGLPGRPLQATRAVDGALALGAVRDGSVSAALLVPPRGRTDSLIVASGGGAALATAVEAVVGHVEASAHRTVTVTDAVPSQTGDARGLSGFYLVVGWLVGGYLVAALLGIASEARPTSARRALVRLVLIAVYAVAAGFGGALVVGPLLGALTGHVVALAAVGSLLVFCAGAVTMAFQALFGVFGIALTLLVFVILGNPSAGGAYSTSLLPPFWRAISSAIPNGAAVQAVRRIVYFGAHDVTGNILVIAAWAIAGAAMALAVARYRGRPVAAGARVVTA
jgi:MFS family permease